MLRAAVEESATSALSAVPGNVSPVPASAAPLSSSSSSSSSPSSSSSSASSSSSSSTSSRVLTSAGAGAGYVPSREARLSEATLKAICDASFSRADADGDGKITFEEFKKLVGPALALTRLDVLLAQLAARPQ